MKIPEKKQKQLEEQGKRRSPPVEGGGAMGRLRQYERSRGLDESGGGNPAAAPDDPAREKDADDESTAKRPASGRRTPREES